MKWKTYGELRGTPSPTSVVWSELIKRFSSQISEEIWTAANNRYDDYFVPIDTETDDSIAKAFLKRAVGRVCDLHANLPKIYTAWKNATVSAAVVDTTNTQATSTATANGESKEKYNAINTAGSKTSGQTDTASESAAESTNFTTTTREDATGIYGAIATADTENPVAAFLSAFEKFLFSPVLWNEGGGYNYV